MNRSTIDNDAELTSLVHSDDSSADDTCVTTPISGRPANGAEHTSIPHDLRVDTSDSPGERRRSSPRTSEIATGARSRRAELDGHTLTSVALDITSVELVCDESSPSARSVSECVGGDKSRRCTKITITAGGKVRYPALSRVDVVCVIIHTSPDGICEGRRAKHKGARTSGREHSVLVDDTGDGCARD